MERFEHGAGSAVVAAAAHSLRSSPCEGTPDAMSAVERLVVCQDCDAAAMGCAASLGVLCFCVEDASFVAVGSHPLRGTRLREWRRSDESLEAANTVARLGTVARDSLSAGGVDYFPIIAAQLALYAVMKQQRVVDLLIATLDRARPVEIVLGRVSPLVRDVLLDVAAARGIPISDSTLGGVGKIARRMVGLIADWRPLARLIRPAFRRMFRSEARAGTIDYLLVNFNPPMMEGPLAVAQALRERVGRVFRLLLPAALARTVASDLPVISIEGLLSVTDHLQCLVRWLGVRRRARAFLTSPEAREVLTHQGVAARAAAGAIADYVARSILPEATLGVVAARVARRRLRPRSIVVVDQADPRARAFALEAGEESAVLQFGLLAETAIEWLFPAAARSFLWGELSRQVAIGMGVAAGRLVVAGAPRMRQADRVASSEVAATRQRFGAERRRIVLYTTMTSSPFDFGNGGELTRAECRELLEQLCDAAAVLDPKVLLLIKPRPLGDDDLSVLLPRQRPSNVVVAGPTADLALLLEACDVFVTFHSAVAVTAVMHDKPVVVVNVTGRRDPAPFVAEGVALGAYSPDAVAPTLHRALEDESARASLAAARERFRRRIAIRIGADAAASVAELLVQRGETA